MITPYYIYIRAREGKERKKEGQEKGGARWNRAGRDKKREGGELQGGIAREGGGRTTPKLCRFESNTSHNYKPRTIFLRHFD